MKILAGSLFLGLLTFIGCNNPRTQDQQNEDISHYADTTHTSENSLDWGGLYEGTTPCADCPGIQTTVTLDYNGTFTYATEYLEREVSTKDSGNFVWQNNGSVVHLQGQEVDIKFQVGENQLFQLDQQGERISGELAAHYILKKIQ